jgi:hypothetical protein
MGNFRAVPEEVIIAVEGLKPIVAVRKVLNP